MRVLKECSPERVFYYFEEICKIPHGSGNTKAISDYLVSFAKEHGLDFVQDEWNNVVIYKKACPGYENAPTVILQGHMDMVCEKRPEVEHDFTCDGLKLSVKNGLISAEGTTLGGDDGIAVAYGLALLESTDIPHPALEVVMTVDEEIGLLGATEFDCSVLKGKRMINLDSEDEGSIWVGCAGGVVGISRIPVRRMEAEGEKLRIRICGLLGGHSGAEIDKKRANANALMGRFLYSLQKKADFSIVSLEGGQKDNAITRESIVDILAEKEALPVIREFVSDWQKKIRKEYEGSDENIAAELLEQGHSCEQVLHPTSHEKVLFFLRQVPFGVNKMNGTIEGLVETSSNFGILQLKKDELYACNSIRSSLESARDALSEKLEYLTEFLGGEYVEEGSYPAWEYRKESPLRDRMVQVYEEMYGKAPAVLAIHAGLECGLFYKKIKDLDCVSIGPDIMDIHTSEETVDIASVNRVWEYLLKVLESLKS